MPSDLQSKKEKASQSQPAIEIAAPRLTVPQLLDQLKLRYNGRGVAANALDPGVTLAHIEKMEMREPIYAELERALPLPLQHALAKRGISQLYCHQAEAINKLRQGHHIALVTATASGKTMCFNLPVLETLLADPQATALYIFPTNALMNDQLATLHGLTGDLGEGGKNISAHKYFGQMSRDEKSEVRRQKPRILLTNPELVHLSLVAWHNVWSQFLSKLKYIVVDEVHTYRGIFGSHMAHVLRRLRRVCEHYGAKPQFVCCSATIGNPLELVENLTGLQDFDLIDQDGSRKNSRHVVVWRPPLFEGDGKSELKPRSYIEETVDLFGTLLDSNFGTLCFARTRRNAENMHRMLGRNRSSRTMGKTAVYRAGLQTTERVRIERGLKDGEIEGVFSTNALELGIDIGGLDAVIVAGYPGSQMALWQQAGRAGRGDKDAVVFLITSKNPIDQYFSANPRDLFTRQAERALLNVENPNIAKQHLLCAVQELPLRTGQLAQYYPVEIDPIVAELEAAGEIINAGGAWIYPMGQPAPHQSVSLRTSTTQRYKLVNQNSGYEIGSIEPPNVYTETFPGAIYSHGGEIYKVDHIDEEGHQVLVYPITDAEKVTSNVGETLIQTELVSQQKRILKLPSGLSIELYRGKGFVTETVQGYRELPLFERGKSATTPPIVYLKKPLQTTMQTEMVWLVLPDRNAFLDENFFDSGLHGLEHLLQGLFPIQVFCDPTDISAASFGSSVELANRPVIYLFDNCEGGAGFAYGCYDKIGELLKLAARTLVSCACKEGCPACIQSPRCREMNTGLSKRATHTILKRLLNAPQTAINASA